MKSLEIGVLLFPIPGRGVPSVVAAEQDGYDVAMMADSPTVFGDVYTQLALAAAATTTIKLGTGVTNPVTRHPATTAAGILSLQHISGGRAILGMGRGDSALGHIGMDYPAKMAVFKPYLEQVKTYLAGGEVDQNGFPAASAGSTKWTSPRSRST